jgi:type IX secretion system PorP/SprF family membrane protein
MKKFVFIFFCCFCAQQLQAQDPQFSQFYANPLYLNPAFAGGDLAPRITFNYRNQWPGIPGNFVTTSVGVDHYFSGVNSGVGLYVMNDVQGNGSIKQTDVAAQYAYHLKINDNLAVRMGIQAGFGNRRIDLSGLTFGDQYTNRGLSGNPTNDPIATNGQPSVTFADFGTGLLVYSDRFWVGGSVQHINRPQLSYFRVLASDRLPMKGSFHAGYKLPLGGYTGLGDEMDKEISITPAVNYRFQGQYSQLDLGVYFTYAPLVVGAWYRGLPIKSYVPNELNQDAIIALVGYRHEKFSLGYSYDFTVSSLGTASGGAHEISLAYTFDYFREKKQRGRRKDKQVSCPKF